jgi:hypothetical protein
MTTGAPAFVPQPISIAPPYPRQANNIIEGFGRSERRPGVAGKERGTRGANPLHFPSPQDAFTSWGEGARRADEGQHQIRCKRLPLFRPSRPPSPHRRSAMGRREGRRELSRPEPAPTAFRFAVPNRTHAQSQKLFSLVPSPTPGFRASKRGQLLPTRSRASAKPDARPGAATIAARLHRVPRNLSPYPKPELL